MSGDPDASGVASLRRFATCRHVFPKFFGAGIHAAQASRAIYGNTDGRTAGVQLGYCGELLEILEGLTRPMSGVTVRGPYRPRVVGATRVRVPSARLSGTSPCLRRRGARHR